MENIKGLKNYIEENSEIITMQHDDCDYCGSSLIDSTGLEEYLRLEDEYTAGKKFCSECCIEQFVVETIGIENYE